MNGGKGSHVYNSHWYPSVASIDGKRVRLVLLHAIKSGQGAMTRTIEGIKAAGLVPCIVDPTMELANTLKRRGWRQRHEGSTFHTPH